ncbi:MAG TPA: PH domain-containing protein [Nocardioides sp.]|nr:PH domain-containing protein [Nocardioides sp.]
MTEAPPELVRDAEWQRLDPRMLLVHPVREVGKFLPVLIGLFVAGSASGGGPWQYLGVLVPITLGVFRYFTTRFRIAQGRVELRRGLLNRHVLSTPLDRVRTVDVTASLIHRILGLATVRIGTGTASTDSDERLDLDGLPADRARGLRAELLHVAPAPAGAVEVAEGPGNGIDERVVLRFQPGWARFAPLTSSGAVIAAGLFGGGIQLLSELGAFPNLDTRDWSLGIPVWVGVVAAAVGLVACVAVLSVTGYLLTNWNFRLSHTPGSWHLSRGLLTTRETSIDDERLAGVSIGEPLSLRLAGAARLSAIVTGLGSGANSSVLAPPAPRQVVTGVAGRVLHTEAPAATELVGHGPAATRRRYSRAVAPALAGFAVAVAVVVAAGWAWWLLAVPAVLVIAAVAVAADRVRSLGHALADGYVVARSGSLNRRREALEVDHVIGWTFRSSWFQRRTGLTTLVATTAGGRQSVTVLDVPEARAVELARLALPELTSNFERPD